MVIQYVQLGNSSWHVPPQQHRKGLLQENHLATLCIPTLYIPVHHPSCLNSELGLTVAQPRSERPWWLISSLHGCSHGTQGAVQSDNLRHKEWKKLISHPTAAQTDCLSQTTPFPWHIPRRNPSIFVKHRQWKSPFSCHGVCAGKEKPNLRDCTE